MTILQLIDALESLHSQHGDLPIHVVLAIGLLPIEDGDVYARKDPAGNKHIVLDVDRKYEVQKVKT